MSSQCGRFRNASLILFLLLILLILQIKPCTSFLSSPISSSKIREYDEPLINNQQDFRRPQSSRLREPSTRTRRRVGGGSGHLYLLNLGNNGEKEKDGQNDKLDNEEEKKSILLSDIDNLSIRKSLAGQEEDFSSWMEGLGSSWPKYPKKKKKQQQQQRESLKEEILNDPSVLYGANEIMENDEMTSERKQTTPQTQQQQQQQQPDFQNNSNVFKNINILSDAADIFASVTSSRANNSIEDTIDEDSFLSLSLPPLPLQSFSSSSSSSSSTNNNNKQRRSAGRYLGRINSLSNFIQFEAILDLAAGVNNETEPYFNSIFTAADQLFKLSKEATDRQAQRSASDLDDKETTAESSTTSLDFSIVDELLSNVTTVKELVERERYFGSLPFQFDKVFTLSSSTTSKSKDTLSEKSSTASSVTNITTAATKTPPTADFIIDDDDDEVQAAASSFLSIDAASSAESSFSTTSSAGLVRAAEAILKDTTARIEYLVGEASNTLLSPNTVQDLIVRASQVFGSGDTTTTTTTTTTALNGTMTTAASASGTSPISGSQFEIVSNEIVKAAQRVAKESGVDVQFATDRAREVTNYAASMARVSNIVLGSGYAYGSRSGASGVEGYPLYEVLSQAQQQQQQQETSVTQQPLFGEYPTAERIEPFQYEHVVVKGAEMGVLAGAIYEDVVGRCHKIGHSLVANGTTSNVAWMITDSLDDASRYIPDDVIPFDDDSAKAPQPMFVRTITIRGFDASDESVDREALLNDICTASPEPLDDATADRVLFHTGLLKVARSVYKDIIKYIDWASPNHKIVLNGHSVGGSLSVLVLLLITSERGGK
jgi:hypothetical protein